MMNQHTISFRSGGVDSTSEMIMMGHYYPVNSAATSTRFLGSYSISNSNSSGFTQPGSCCGSVFGDSVAGLKHDAGLAVEWSVEEQHKLNEGLSKFADESSIMRYIKIAATLNDKTVRDVAMRCRWMARKRRKPDEPHMAKRFKDKDKKDTLVVSSSSKPNISSVPKFDVAPFSVAMNNRDQIDGNTFEALCGSIKQLVEQNNKVLGQISANIFSMKLQDNIKLFSHTKDNITAILNDMRYVPGPPFRVSLNEDLARNILPHSHTNQYMKQEPEF